MTWFGIIKQPELKPASKIKTNITESISDDEPCKEKMLEFLRKLGDKPPVELNNFQRFRTSRWKQYRLDSIKLVEEASEQEICDFIKAVCLNKTRWSAWKSENKLFKEIVCGE